MLSAFALPYPFQIPFAYSERNKFHNPFIHRKNREILKRNAINVSVSFFLLCSITTLFFLTSSCFAQVKVYERWNMCSLILSKWVLFGFAYFSLIFITLSNKHSFLRDEVCLNENRSDLEDERLQHSTDFFSGEKFSTIHIKSDTV